MAGSKKKWWSLHNLFNLFNAFTKLFTTKKTQVKSKKQMKQQTTRPRVSIFQEISKFIYSLFATTTQPSQSSSAKNHPSPNNPILHKVSESSSSDSISSGLGVLEKNPALSSKSSSKSTSPSSSPVLTPLTHSTSNSPVAIAEVLINKDAENSGKKSAENNSPRSTKSIDSEIPEEVARRILALVEEPLREGILDRIINTFKDIFENKKTSNLLEFLYQQITQDKTDSKEFKRIMALAKHPSSALKNLWYEQLIKAPGGPPENPLLLKPHRLDEGADKNFRNAPEERHPLDILLGVYCCGKTYCFEKWTSYIKKALREARNYHYDLAYTNLKEAQEFKNNPKISQIIQSIEGTLKTDPITAENTENYTLLIAVYISIVEEQLEIELSKYRKILEAGERLGDFACSDRLFKLDSETLEDAIKYNIALESEFIQGMLERTERVSKTHWIYVLKAQTFYRLGKYFHHLTEKNKHFIEEVDRFQHNCHKIAFFQAGHNLELRQTYALIQNHDPYQYKLNRDHCYRKALETIIIELAVEPCRKNIDYNATVGRGWQNATDCFHQQAPNLQQLKEFYSKLLKKVGISPYERDEIIKVGQLKADLLLGKQEELKSSSNFTFAQATY